MTAFESERGGPSPEDMPQPEYVENALSPSDLGDFLLAELGLDSSYLTPLEQRKLRLADIQARHHQELVEVGADWRIAMEASRFDHNRPAKPLLPDGVPYRLKVFQHDVTYNDKRAEATGVHVVAQTLQPDGKLAEQRYSVVMALNCEPFGIFREDEVNAVLRQAKELKKLRAELQLTPDLSQVITAPSF